jgi:hypothetical protein
MLAAWPEQDPTPRLENEVSASSNPVAYGDVAESGSGSEHLAADLMPKSCPAGGCRMAISRLSG